MLFVRKQAWVFRMSHGAPARRAIAVVITLQCTSIAYAAAKTPQYQLRASGQARASCPVCMYVDVCRTPDLALCVCIGLCVYMCVCGQSCKNVTQISFWDEGVVEGVWLCTSARLLLCLQTSRGRASGDTPCPRRGVPSWPESCLPPETGW